jgi:phosphoenolpyruvate carboxykinase (GTP)
VTTLKELQAWVDQVAELTQPDDIHWCDGSADEYQRMAEVLLSEGGFVTLNPDTHPGCYLHRSDPSDVARVEHLTYVCTSKEEDAGSNNNWMAPEEARKRLQDLFRGCMRGRTMYVIPYCMGPIDSPLSRCGVEITDSAYSTPNAGSSCIFRKTSRFRVSDRATAATHCSAKSAMHCALPVIRPGPRAGWPSTC